MTDETNTTATDAAPAKTTKSIVPSKYSGRYKNGGEDPLALFIKAQCATPEGFSFPHFFDLCEKNGIAADKVAHYKAQVAEKRHGAEGRARMTLRNMLATIVRKNGKALGLDGSEVAIDLPKPALTGAAKAAKATSTDKSTEAAPAGTL
jgi:plasmid stability protein